MRPYTCKECKRELIHHGMRGPLPKLCHRCAQKKVSLITEEIPVEGIFMPYRRPDWHAVVYGGRRR